MALSPSLHLVSIPVRDQERPKTFYTSYLDFNVIQDQPLGDEPSRRILLQAPHGGTKVGLLSWLTSMPAESLRGLVLACDQLKATVAALEALGVRFSDEAIQSAPWGRCKALLDPKGSALIVQQHAQVL